MSKKGTRNITHHGFNMTISDRAQSRRDGTLLTAGFNLRSGVNKTLPKSRRDNTNISPKFRPCGTWKTCSASIVRRINSTVIKAPSLRDFSRTSITQKHLDGGANPALMPAANQEAMSCTIDSNCIRSAYTISKNDHKTRAYPQFMLSFHTQRYSKYFNISKKIFENNHHNLV